MNRSRLFIILGSYLFIALITAGYLLLPAKYASEFTVTLPGSAENNSLKLDDLGQLTSDSKGPFGNTRYDPRVNYKQILTADNLLNKAARKLKLATESVAKPKIKLIEQTSMIQVTIKGDSAQGAEDLAWSLYQGFQEQLVALRNSEQQQRDKSIEQALQEHRQQLDKTRQQLLNFQASALILSEAQYEQHILRLDHMRSTLSELSAEKQHLERYLNVLARDLGVSSSMAGAAFTLQTDGEYQGYLNELSAVASSLSQARAKWGKAHPDVKAQSARYQMVKASLKSRSRLLIGDDVPLRLDAINLQASADRARLFGQLVEGEAKRNGLESQLMLIRNDSAVLDDQLRLYARELGELRRLQREHQLAETVYSAAAARLQANKNDQYSAYPVVQLLNPPSLIWKPVSPHRKLALVGALVGCIFITIAWLVLWQRQKIITLLLNND